MGFAGRNKNGLYELQCISEVRPRASPLRLRFFCFFGIYYFVFLAWQPYACGTLVHYYFHISGAVGGSPNLGGGAGGAEDEKELDGTAARETRSNDRLSGSCRGGAATAGASGASRLAAATATAGAASARAAAPATSRASSDRAAAIATAGASSGRAAETASTSS